VNETEMGKFYEFLNEKKNWKSFWFWELASKNSRWHSFYDLKAALKWSLAGPLGVLFLKKLKIDSFTNSKIDWTLKFKKFQIFEKKNKKISNYLNFWKNLSNFTLFKN